MKVRVGTKYVYHANLLDKADARTNLKDGDLVRVINLPGAPRANVFGHCYVEHPETHQFIGLVCTNSLHTIAQYKTYLKEQIAKHEKEQQ